jgi:general secretion pathway protein H
VARLGLELRLRQEGRRVPLDDRADRPQVVFNGAGELTPFELEIRREGSTGAELRINGQRDGRLLQERLQ